VPKRLIAYWVYGGSLAGVLLLAMTPVLGRNWPHSLWVVFLCLPIYMLHQLEEHDDDRFRRFINRMIGDGREVLSPLAVFVINVPGVWGVIGVSFWLATAVNVGLGLIGIYLVLVNGIVHSVHGLASRSYNPGLATAVLLFLPLGLYGVGAIDTAGGGTTEMHVIGLAVSLGIHVAIVAHVLRNRHVAIGAAS
jgi:hypothetical protein